MAHRWTSEDGKSFEDIVRRMAFAAGPVADFNVTNGGTVANVSFDTSRAAAAFVSALRAAGYDPVNEGAVETYLVYVQQK